MNSMNRNKFDGRKLGTFIFDCFIAVVWLAFSIVLLFTPYFNHSILNRGLIIMLGVVFGLYGLFRLYRAFIKVKQRND
jgi:H+/Cl- antiporter ClcA